MLVHENKQTAVPTRVLILGSGGFLSPHLQKALAAAGAGHRALGSAEVDLRRPESSAALARVIAPDDTVVMMAALTPDKGRDLDTFMSNVRMGETVCRALEAAPCRHFIYLSSDAVYDADKTPLDEDSTREPVDLYALTHTNREMMLASVLAKRATPFCILRPTNIYGPGDTHNNYGPNRFVRTAVRDGRIVLFGRGEERRSHLYVRDAVELIVRTILWRSSGILNLAARPAVSFRRVADTVVRHCANPVRIEFEARTIQPIHRPYKATQVFRFLSKFGRQISPIVHRPYAVSAIFKAFPDFHYTPLDEGVAAFIKSVGSAAAPTKGSI
jgi:nucleoside-diphosphate-sugar epimerase